MSRIISVNIEIQKFEKYMNLENEILTGIIEEVVKMPYNSPIIEIIQFDSQSEVIEIFAHKDLKDGLISIAKDKVMLHIIFEISYRILNIVDRNRITSDQEENLDTCIRCLLDCSSRWGWV